MNNIINKIIESYSEKEQINILEKAGYTIDLNYKCWERYKDYFNDVEYVDRFVKVAYLNNKPDRNIDYIKSDLLCNVFRGYIENKIVEKLKKDLFI